MPIYYTIKAIKNNIEGGSNKKYYLMARSIGRIKRKELIEEMTRTGSVDASTAEAVMNYLYEAIIYFLKMGYTVDLDDLGHIITTIKSTGSDTEEEANYLNAEDIKVHLVPGRKLRETIRTEPVHKYPVLEKDYKSRHDYFLEKISDEVKQEQASEIARRCLAEGIDEALIGRLTGLSDEEIEAIKREG